MHFAIASRPTIGACVKGIPRWCIRKTFRKKRKKPSGDVYLLLGQAHFQIEQYKEALEPIQTAVNINREQGKQPKENWLLLLRVIHYELKDY